VPITEKVLQLDEAGLNNALDLVEANAEVRAQVVAQLRENPRLYIRRTFHLTSAQRAGLLTMDSEALEEMASAVAEKLEAGTPIEFWVTKRTQQLSTQKRREIYVECGGPCGKFYVRVRQEY
jgi:hypothetical protein